MFSVVTLSLRAISVMERASNRRMSANGHIPSSYGSLNPHEKYNESLVHSLLHGLDKPIPDHITFPPRLDILPSRVLMFYFDQQQALETLKTKPVNEAFCLGVGQYRRIIADITSTSETELRAFIIAAGVVKNYIGLRKKDLMAALILGDYRKAAADRTRITVLHTRLEAKLEKLNKRIREAKVDYIDSRSTKVDKENAVTLRSKATDRSSAGQTEAAKIIQEYRRYNTRRSSQTSSGGGGYQA